MIYPKFLHEKATIGVPAPSDGAKDLKKKNKIKQAEKYWTSLGYKLVLSKKLYHSEKGRSANAKERAEEINKMLERKDIDVILCASGGDFLLEILPNIDFNLLVKNPKLMAGFSDPTGLLYPITSKYDIATIYGSNFSSFGTETLHKSHTDFLNVLRGKEKTIESYDFYEKNYKEKITGLESYNLTEKVYWKTLDEKDVEIEGRILGGCFDILSELAGTKYDGIQEFNKKYKEDGIIWFFDNCEMSMEEVIRVLWKMKELEYFKYAKGIIFGRFGVDKSYYDYDTKSCLEDSVLKELKIPVIYDTDISHKSPCMPIINGSVAHVRCKEGKGKIDFRLE